MVQTDIWMNRFLQALDERFAKRVWFVGLQGSYGRGEATENSDIDVVVILDALSGEDIRNYHSMLNTLPHRELICGFLSGKDEILNWEPADLFQFYHDTTPVRGNLDELCMLLDNAAVNRAIKTGACNIYHGCVHNMLHEKSEEILKGLFKSASFVVQAICFQQTGRYIRRQKDLMRVVSRDERMILETYSNMKNNEKTDFSAMSEVLFNWAKGWIEKTK